MTLRQLLLIMGRRWVVILVCVAAALAGSALYLERRVASYQASATVQLTVPNSATSQPLLSLPDPGNAVSSNAVAVRAARLLGANSRGALAGHVSGSFDATTNLLTIMGSNRRPKAAQALANAFARAYVLSVQATAQGRIAKLDATLVSLHNQITTLEKQTTGLGATSNPAASAELSSLLQTYGTLTLQVESLQDSEPYATVQTSASLPSQPLGSSKRTIAGLALLVGLLAGIGLALVSEQLDTRIRSDLDLDGLTDVPVLAELPLQRRDESGGTSLSFIDRPNSAVSESFRELRTSIRAATGGRRGVCIMITSPAPGDGKTFVTANLAAAEATTGRQVAVVSADLHDRRIELVLGCSEVAPIGLSHLSWLPQNGRLDQQRDHGGVHAEAQTAQRDSPVQVERLADAPLRTSLAPKQEPLSEDREMGTRWAQGELSGNLVRTAVPGLSLLPAGDNGSDLSEVFADNRIDALIEELKLTFDVVFFDTPAVMSAPDAAILSRAVDGVVVVVSAGRTRRGVVERALERLHSIQAPLLGVALNRVTSSTSATYHPLRRSPKQLGRDERHRTLGAHSRELSKT